MNGVFITTMKIKIQQPYDQKQTKCEEDTFLRPYIDTILLDEK